MIAIRTTNRSRAEHLVPIDWQLCRLDELSNVVRGSSPRPAGDPRYFDGDHIPWITVADVTDVKGPYLCSTKSMLTAEGEARTRVLEPGTLMLTNSGATLGVPRITRLRAGANDGIAAFLELSADPLYLYFTLENYTAYFREQLAPGVGQPNLNTDLIGSTLVRIPPPNEQQAIVTVLNRWETYLVGIERLTRLRRRLKRGLLKSLLTGERRFPEFRDEPWVDRRVGDVLQETSRLVDWNDEEHYRLASIRRGSRGLFDRGSLFGRDIKVKKLHTIREGDFLISHIQAAYGAMGTVPEEFDGAKVSDMYSILTPKTPGCIDMRFVNYLSQRKEMRHMAYLSSNGFFAERLRLNFDPHDFLNRKLLLPPTVEEQSKIADVLETLDREIELLTDLHEALQEQKKGLMQQLLTGKVRVPESMLKEAAHA